VRFDKNNSYYNGNFENTDMSGYLNDIFWKEMQPSCAVEASAADTEQDLVDKAIDPTTQPTAFGADAGASREDYQSPFNQRLRETLEREALKKIARGGRQALPEAGPSR
jgi:hypothetical protein